MNRDNIKKGLSKLINEDGISGQATTKKAQNTSKKSNDAYYKDVKKKMKEYDNEITTKDDDAIEPKKTNAEGSEKEYHDEMEIRNGQEMLNYDNEPSKQFNDRAIKAIVGDSSMGNKTYTGEENGNTEPMWGASDANFGQKLVNTIKASKKKRDDATGTFNQFGDDIEMAPGKPKVSKKKVAVEGMKRIKFKKPFGGVENALNLIPEAFRVDGKQFELTDGNEKYKVLWTEGAAKVLDAEDKNMLSEDYNKMKHLMGFKVGADAGTLDGKGRVSENKTLAAGFAEGNGFAPIEETEEDIEEDVNHFGMGGSDELNEWSPYGSPAFIKGDKKREPKKFEGWKLVPLSTLEVGDTFKRAPEFKTITTVVSINDKGGYLVKSDDRLRTANNFSGDYTVWVEDL